MPRVESAKNTRRRLRSRWTGWAFLAPFATAFVIVFIAPIIYSLYLSLFSKQLIGGEKFVGFANFSRAFSDPELWNGAGRVVIFFCVQVPIMLFISLYMALVLDSRRLHGTAFFRISVFIPYAVPAVVAALMWGFMYGTRFGLVGNINRALNIHIPDPLGPDLMLAAIGNIVTWEFIGYNMLILYSSLKAIPNSLYEAAAIDGASQFRIIWSIKLPAIRGALVIALIFSVIGSFQLFNEPNVLKTLAPNVITSHYTPNLYAYSLSFSGQQPNYSATVAIIMGIITMIVAYVVQLRGMKTND